MAEAYRESANPNAAASFPYLVREVAHGRSLTFDPCFHSMHWHADVQFIYVADGTIDVATLREYFIGTRTALHVLEELVRFTKTLPPPRPTRAQRKSQRPQLFTDPGRRAGVPGHRPAGHDRAINRTIHSTSPKLITYIWADKCLSAGV